MARVVIEQPEAVIHRSAAEVGELAGWPGSPGRAPRRCGTPARSQDALVTYADVLAEHRL